MTAVQIDEIAEELFVSDAAYDQMIPVPEGHKRFEEHRKQRTQLYLRHINQVEQVVAVMERLGYTIKRRQAP